MEINASYKIRVSVFKNVNGNPGELIDEKVYSSNIVAHDEYSDNVEVIDYSDEEGKYMFGIKPETEFVVLNNIRNKNLTMANLNSSNKIVKAEDSRRVLNGFLLDAPESSRRDDSYAGKKIVNFDFNEKEEFPETEILSSKKEFVLPALDAPVKFERASNGRYAVSGCVNKFDINNLTTDGNTYRYIWLDNSIDMDSFSYKKVTLRAVGKYNDETVCFVWVADENYTDGESCGNKVNSSVAQHIADNFSARYMEEREVFGAESDELFKYNSEGQNYSSRSMSENSDTGKYVNIVVYDICQDFETQKSGISGYFWSKDYFDVEEKDFYPSNGIGRVFEVTNAGKYFYVDAPFCNFNPDGATEYKFSGVEDGTKASDEVLSTLLHEFQHMVNYGMKAVKWNQYSPTWYNEMCSMLAEDMFQNAMNISYYNSPKARLMMFNYNYDMSGVTDWRSDSNVLMSYASAYAFGAWLARNYGGVPLVKKMLNNNYVGMESVLDAVNSHNNLSLTKKDLLEQYIQAVVFRPEFAASKNIPSSFFKDGVGYETEDHTSLELSKINLYSNKNTFVNRVNEGYGPYRYNIFSRVEVRGNGFVLKGRANSYDCDTIVLRLSKSPSYENLSQENRPVDDVYFFIQDEFDIYSPSNLE